MDTKAPAAEAPATEATMAGATVNRAGPKRSRFGLAPRTIRARLALFYFGAFTLSGALLLVTTVGYWQTATGAQVSAVPARGPGQPGSGSRAGPLHKWLNTAPTHTSWLSPPPPP